MPPDIEIANWIATRESVTGVFSSDTPISLIEPSARVGTLLDDVRGVINLPPQGQYPSKYRPRICVLDTGLDLTHPDFAVVPESQIRDFTSTGGPLDGNGHGTHVAGTAVGSGVASNGRYRGIVPEADLWVGKVLPDSGSGGGAWLLAALDWALDHEVDVINMSLGHSVDRPGEDLTSSAVSEVAASGIIVCASAGNEGPEPMTVGSPAEGEGVIAIAATYKSGRLAEFSSRGNPTSTGWLGGKPDISAPGVEITAPRSQFSADPGDMYTTYSGTSSACPMVTGLAGYLLSTLDSRDIGESRERVKRALIAGAKILDPSSSENGVWEIGAGVVDAQASLNALGV